MQHPAPTVEPGSLECMHLSSASLCRGQEHFQGLPAVVGGSQAMEGRHMGCRQAHSSMRVTGSVSYAAGHEWHRHSAAPYISCMPAHIHALTSSFKVPGCMSSSVAQISLDSRLSMPASISGSVA